MGCAMCKPREVIDSPEILRPSRTYSLVNPHFEVKILPSAFINRRNTSLRSHYIIGEDLGQGSFGIVRRVTHIATGQKRALKTISKDNISKDLRDRAKFNNEIDILRSTDHPNIIKLFEFYEDSFNYHLVTELVQGGDLSDFLKKTHRIPEPTAACFMKQILGAVAYCHSKNIVHRDLKPQHLLLTRQSKDAILKLIDFGNSALDKTLTDIYGTAHYIAPEVLNENYNEKCDIWSCGVMLYEILTNQKPFRGRDQEEILERVKKGTFTMSSSISSQAADLISRMIEKDPTKRISASEALEHSWISLHEEISPGLQDSALHSLKEFSVQIKFQQAVLAFIAHQLVGREHSEKLTELFRSMDTNGDGKLSKEELVEAYSKNMDRDTAEFEVDAIFNMVDMSYSGHIDYTEFVMATAERQTMINSKNLERAFSEFDKDKNGRISADELKLMLGDSENHVPEAVWKELIQEADTNGDGEIDFQEFKVLMLKISEI